MRSLVSSIRLTRRAFLVRGTALAAGTMCPWPSAFGQKIDPSSATLTLEAFADTLIPGEKRFAGDRAIAGVVSGAGAVQGGAIELLNFPPVGLQPVLPVIAVAIDLAALLYAITHKIVLDLTVPPFVALDFDSRSDLLDHLLEREGPLRTPLQGLAALCFLAYHTAAYLPTADAVRNGHPGLKAIGFPPPDVDGVWRFADFSYRRALAVAHPSSRNGNPA